VYCDTQWIEHLVSKWQGRWGEKRVLPWYTNRPKQMAFALRAFKAAQTSGDVSHDGDSQLSGHVENAKKKRVSVRDDDGRQLWVITKDAPMSPRKIDAAMAACLSWECRMDAIAAGATVKRRSAYEDRGLQTVG
jgi:hypothetical protein